MEESYLSRFLLICLSTLFPFMMGCVLCKGTPLHFNTVQDIPQAYFDSHLSITVKVVSVSDGDTFRGLHVSCPQESCGCCGISSSKSNGGKNLTQERWKGNLKKETLLIRLYAVDAPETAKGGKLGQPFAEEATELLKKQILGKVVTLKLLERDQYGRALARIRYYGGMEGCWGFLGLKTRHDLSDDLLKAGYATIYRGRGAEYDERQAKLEALEKHAKKKKKGMWSLPESELVTPAQYKQKTKKNRT